MARPVRLEFGGALYHVTARGDRREAMYEDGTNREQFLAVFGDVVERFNWGNGLAHSVTRPDGSLSETTYDLAGRTDTIEQTKTGATIARSHYRYDLDGNRLGKSRGHESHGVRKSRGQV